MDVREGEFVSIVGRSGCGKTTLLKIIAGLLAPTRGSAKVLGAEVTGPLGSVGVVFQNPLLMPWRSVKGNVMLPAELTGRDTRSLEARARDLLRLAGLSGFEALRPRELSGGLQQRVSLVRAILLDPGILLMDEPFGSLDELTREEMAMDLLRITQALKKTTVFVTHSVTEAVMLSDRVVVLTPRPSTIRATIPIGLPRPRSPGLRSSPDFQVYCDKIRSAIGVATS